MNLKSYDRLVVRLAMFWMLIVGSVSPIFIHKSYVYILSPACVLFLLLVVYRYARRRFTNKGK